MGKLLQEPHWMVDIYEREPGCERIERSNVQRLTFVPLGVETLVVDVRSAEETEPPRKAER